MVVSLSSGDAIVSVAEQMMMMVTDKILACQVERPIPTSLDYSNLARSINSIPTRLRCNALLFIFNCVILKTKAILGQMQHYSQPNSYSKQKCAAQVPFHMLGGDVLYFRVLNGK